MFQATNKRKKPLTPSDLKEMGLKGVLGMLSNEVTIHNSLSDWGSQLNEGKTDGLGLFLSSYRADGFGINTHVVHPAIISAFEVKRDEAGVVTQISDGKSRVKGKALEKLQVLTYAALEGYSEVIYESHEREDVASDVLLMPKTVQFSELAVSKKKEYHEIAVELYKYVGKLNVFTSQARVKELVSLSYLDVSNVRSVLFAYNNVLEREAYKFDKASLETLEGLQKELETAEKPSHAKFLQTLIAAKVDSTKDEEKVKAFCQNPDAEFCRVLGLKKPHAGTLFEKGTNNKVERVSLNEVDKDSEILMSSVVIDSKYYESIRSDPGELTVFVSTANVGILKNRKWVELKNRVTMKASHLLSVLDAIARSNRGKTNTAAAKGDSSTSDEDQEDLSF